MASKRLPNYLRKYRKRSALSQDELTYLLGAGSGAKVCRYERFIRNPSLRTALACEVVFRKPVSELFPGLFHEIEAAVKERANKLSQRKCAWKPAHVRRKLQTIDAILGPEPKSE